MKLLHTNNFDSLSVVEGQSLSLIDVFDVPWKKIITLDAHSLLIYLVVGPNIGVDIDIVTRWPHCSCMIFWLFRSDAHHVLTDSLKVSLTHSHTSANVELISFLYEGAKISIDGSLDILPHIDQVHGHLLEQNIILGKNISLKTLPKLNIASYNVTAAHGASIDTFDHQKLFYMMSRGLTKEQSQTLLVHGYIDYVLGHFKDISDKDKEVIRTLLKN